MTTSHVAWLKDREFLLDAYCAGHQHLPFVPPEVTGPVSCYAIDAPQGLPEKNSNNRRCDREAGTPTNKLPTSREELQGWVLYKGLIAMGIGTFWNLYNRPDTQIHGLSEKMSKEIIVIETYPRKTAKMLGLDPLPSKRKKQLKYIHHVWGFLKSMGYRCLSVVTPTVDQVDAMLCAIAAQAFMAGSIYWRAMGSAPFIYPGEDVIREGFIVCPTSEWLKNKTEPQVDY